MSFLANPTNLRLGLTKYWSNAWSLSQNINYSYLISIDTQIKKYIYWWYEQYNFLSNSFVISNVIVTRSYKKLNIYIFIRYGDWIGELWGSFIQLKKNILLKRNIFINYFYKKGLTYNTAFENMIWYLPRFISNDMNIEKHSKHLLEIDEVKAKRLLKRKKIIFWFIFLQKAEWLYKNRYRNHWLWMCYKSLLKILKLYLDYLVLIKKIIYNKNTFKNLFMYTFLSRMISMSVSYIALIFNKTIINKLITKYGAYTSIFSVVEPYIIVSSQYLCTYIKLRLRQLHPIQNIIRYLFSKIGDIGVRIKRDFIGIKIIATGRFTRRERKIYMWKYDGKIDQANIASFVDFYSTSIAVKNSTCGIKVWINIKKEFILNNNILTTKNVLHTYKI